jgi:hypothetical protein
LRVDAVIFDIGGVLEITPPTGWQARWTAKLDLPPDQLERRLERPFEAGSTGHMTLPDVEREIATALGLDDVAVLGLMEDLWTEYLGTLNETMANYFAGLRPRYRTAILRTALSGSGSRSCMALPICATCSSTRTRKGA